MIDRTQVHSIWTTLKGHQRWQLGGDKRLIQFNIYGQELPCETDGITIGKCREQPRTLTADGPYGSGFCNFKGVIGMEYQLAEMPTVMVNVEPEWGRRKHELLRIAMCPRA